MKKEISPITMATAVLGILLLIGFFMWRSTSQPTPPSLPADAAGAVPKPIGTSNPF